jgi:tetratricopeptide (TPR) repeat protein
MMLELEGGTRSRRAMSLVRGPACLRSAFAAAWLMLAAHALAAECAVTLARVVSVQGAVEFRRAQSAQWSAAAIDAELCVGDSLRVGERSRAALRLANDSNLRLDQNTTLTLDSAQDRVSLIELLRGAISAFTRTPQPFKVRTPFVNAGVEGTEFLVRVESDAAQIAVFEGTVSADNDLGTVTLVSGDVAVAARGAAPRRERIVRPAQAVQWALHYPTIIAAGSAEETPLREADALVRRGRIAEAFARLDAVPAETRNARHAAYRAELLLLVGRVDEARAEIARALALDPRSSDAHALQAVIALVQNEEAEALRLARTAVELDSRSATARIALSYAEQARFDIAAALGSVEQAAALAPDNALAWARVAELRMASGDLDAALAAARRASSLEAELSRTQTVLGFAHLTRIEIAEARQAFGRAIALDQADPLPRLGLGLARIRDGELAAGREQIEIAASLDPLNSLMRSYLGKAYYEENRDPLAGAQFDLAKALDPKDPTPWFYDAIRQQTENRPVQALRNLEKSIELNDDRAVYRSRLLLDQDLAARGARLGQSYRDLGFEPLALVEGWRSIERDPSNHSAHRLLADSYLSLPRHEIARDSELLQSQLLQPLNQNPVQPQLATSGLGLLQDAGLLQLSLNEYSQLFESDGIRLHLAGIVGNRGVFADNLIVSGLNHRISFSLGHFGSRTDGFRANNDLRNEIANAFVQAAVSPTTSLQAETRRVEKESGDRFITFFDAENYSPTFRETFVQRALRLGLRQVFDARNVILGSYVRQDLEDTLFPGGVVTQDGHLLELRHLHQSAFISVSTGLSHFRGTQDDTNLQFVPPASRLRAKLRHSTVYAYGTFNANSALSLYLGASYDSFSSPQVERHQLNPKFGATWTLRPYTTVRAGAFKTVKREVITSQTIEPTQIAGFNQFFDDINGTSTWRYGLAVDQKADSHRFWGVEASWRKRSLPPRRASMDRSDVKFDETFGRAYLLWLPGTRTAVSAEYLLERLEGDAGSLDPNGVNQSSTHRMPVQVRLFAPRGLTARIAATYINQKGRFVNVPLGAIEAGRDGFWIVDASLAYRLPQRRGLLSMEIRNAFDRTFRFQDSEPDNSSVARTRVVLARLVVEF